MRQLYSLLIALACSLGASRPLTAQVVNGGFETRNSEPRGLNNIAPGQFDDLPYWTKLAGSAHYQTNQTSVSWGNTRRNVCCDNWPAYAPFNPYEGSGCVELVGDGPQTFGVIGQQLNLTPGNRYRVQFYVKRQPTNRYRARIALTVHNSQPARVLGGSLSPSPTATILSPYVTNTGSWMLVTGEFVAQAATQWIAIGYENVQGVFDSNLAYVQRVNENGLAVSTDYYTINVDGVSAVDLGCATPSPTQIDGFADTSLWRIKAEVNAVPGATSYNWYRNGVKHNQYGVFVTIPMNRGECDRSYRIEVEAVGPCGVSLGRASRLFYPDCANAASYPNPAAEQVTLPEGTEQAEVLDKQGKVVLNHKASNGRVLSVQSLPDGLYQLRTVRNGKVKSQRLQIKH